MTDATDVEKSYERSDFVTELRRLADSVESGENFELEINGETITVPASAFVSVEFEQEDGKAEMEFQLSWDVEKDVEDVEDEIDEQETEAESRAA